MRAHGFIELPEQIGDERRVEWRFDRLGGRVVGIRLHWLRMYRSE